MKVMMITGAGISASSGLPTYRGPNGIYTEIEAKSGLKIEDLLSAKTLESSPELLWAHWRDLTLRFREAVPTKTHWAIRELSDASDKYFLLWGLSKAEGNTLDQEISEIPSRLPETRFLEVTQNVDGLSLMTGMNKRNIIELHGSYSRHRCTKCKNIAPVSVTADMVIPPCCTICKSKDAIMRPRVVMFRESINDAAYTHCREYAKKTDLLIVAGTSLQMAYMADLVALAIEANALVIYIDPEASPYKRTLLALDYELEVDQHMICLRKPVDEIFPSLSKLIVEKNPSQSELRAWCVAQSAQ
jgi:NAD-dependent deacetylase